MTNKGGGLVQKIQIIPRKRIEDKRGWFLKILDDQGFPFSQDVKEVYFTAAFPKETKGNHFHYEASEWFTLIEGTCMIVLEDSGTKERHEKILDSSNPETIFVPPLIAHKFVNIGKGNFILCALTDRYFDTSDTVPYNL